MLNQNNLVPNRLVSLNNNISYIITLNLLGDIISQHHNDTAPENAGVDNIASKFRKITTATSLLNFDNIKFLMYEEDDLKHVILNFKETSMIIGFSKNATLSDVLHILGEFTRKLYAGP